MNSNSGQCYVVRQPYTDSTATTIFGRNSCRPEGEASEVVYFPASDNEGKQKCQHVEIDGSKSLSIILSKPAGVWGAESGANNKNVAIAITWTENEPSDGVLCSTDLVRLGLERAESAAEAVDVIANLAEQHCNNDRSVKLCFIICDPNETWLLNVVGRLWAAELVIDGYRSIPLGLSITSKIDKSSCDLQKNIIDLGLWDGTNDLNFNQTLSNAQTTTENWPESAPNESEFGVTNMFNILRNINGGSPQTSYVSTLSANGLSCYWFTGTPNPIESVFKPFVFTENVRISPLTKIQDGADISLLQQLHGQRNWSAVGDLLKSLEATCVDEVRRAIGENQVPNQEFDELLKDCVEAEVKFYR